MNIRGATGHVHGMTEPPQEPQNDETPAHDSDPDPEATTEEKEEELDADERTADPDTYPQDPGAVPREPQNPVDPAPDTAT